MNFLTAMDVAASGMSAQRTNLNVISMNMANMRTTRTATGGPYIRQTVSLEAQPVLSPFDSAMNEQVNRELVGVKVGGIVQDERPFRMQYEPNHPDANEQGYVAYPDINVVEEMTNMITTMRGFEANVQSVTAVKQMFQRAIMIGRG